MTTVQKPLHSWREAATVYKQPAVLTMLLFGFSAGLPFALVSSSTLSAWLSDSHINSATIGFFSWIGLMYSIKVFWAPLADRMPLPILTRLFGQRRSWLLLSQLGIASGLLLLSFGDPQQNLMAFIICTMLVAFSSATQDVVIDAFRIESASKEYQAAMSASYVLGYRIATLVAGAGALYLAQFFNWHLSYQVMALLMLIGIATTLLIREPQHTVNTETLQQEEKLAHEISASLHAKSGWQKITEKFSVSVISPFAEFFHRCGWNALLILLLIGCYRMTDTSMGTMATPFYLDLGFSKSDIASVTKVFGFFLTFAGTALGGILVMRYGIMRIMLIALLTVIGSNLMFAWLASQGPDISALALVIGADNLAGGMATAVFIAYLSSLTNTAYTATQYALFSSVMTLFPRIISGFSGVIVELVGYKMFFIYTSLFSLPALLIILFMLKSQKATDL